VPLTAPDGFRWPATSSTHCVDGGKKDFGESVGRSLRFTSGPVVLLRLAVHRGAEQLRILCLPPAGEGDGERSVYGLATAIGYIQRWGLSSAVDVSVMCAGLGVFCTYIHIVDPFKNHQTAITVPEIAFPHVSKPPQRCY
jgi:hypothetical protein